LESLRLSDESQACEAIAAGRTSERRHGQPFAVDGQSLRGVTDLRVQHSSVSSRCLPRSGGNARAYWLSIRGQELPHYPAAARIASSSPRRQRPHPARNSLRGFLGALPAQHVRRASVKPRRTIRRTGTPFGGGVASARACRREIDQRDVVSWPTAEISGSCFAAARTTISSLNDHRSSSEPPRATINRSGLGILPPSGSALNRDRRRDLFGRPFACTLRPYQHAARNGPATMQDVADHRPVGE